MPPSLQALAPVFLLIAAGQVMRRAAFPAAGFWQAAERLVYWCLFPALLFEATATVTLGDRRILLIGIATAAPVVLIVLLLLALRRPLRLDGRRLAALAQAAVRPNTYIGLAAAVALWGQAALPPLALVIALNIPLVNLIAGILLASSGGRGVRPLRLVLMVLGNPLILACLLGLATAAAGLALPPVLGATLGILGHASLALALLAVGAALEPGRIKGSSWAILLGATLKLLALPALTLLATRLLGLGGLDQRALVLMAALPLSASAYVQTRQMGGAADLMAASMTVQTVLAAATIPLVLGLLR
jgi:predicted permease